MAVHTKISREQLANHLLNYNIGELLDFQEIVEGIDNSNFIIKTSKNKFIFTIFEARINVDSLPYFINLKKHLQLQGIPCPKPIEGNNGEIILNFGNKKSTIVSFLDGASLKPKEDGYYSNITADHCYQIGEILAKMHLATLSYKLHRDNDLAIDGLQKLFYKFQDLLQNYDQEIFSLITQEISVIKNSWNPNLQSSACHLDLFPDNVFFQDDKISAVIDFYFSANDLLIYDLAIVINAWCFDKTIFNQEKFLSLVNGYKKIKKLSIEEIIFLPTALKCASMRFLITRLHDYFFTPKNSLVKVKDPQEYKAKLQFFINNKINFL
jgi:homoserine kinase type II